MPALAVTPNAVFLLTEQVFVSLQGKVCHWGKPTRMETEAFQPLSPPTPQPHTSPPGVGKPRLQLLEYDSSQQHPSGSIHRA